MEGRGKCRAILSRSFVAPLDVLMHVGNNLTANLLHSFSFLFRTFRPASAAHLPDPSFCTLSDARAGPSPDVALLASNPSPFLCSESRASAAPLAPNRIHNLNFWVIQIERERERDRKVRVEEEKHRDTGQRRTDAPCDKFMNFMGIWGELPSRITARRSWSVSYRFSLVRICRFLLRSRIISDDDPLIQVT